MYLTKSKYYLSLLVLFLLLIEIEIDKELAPQKL